MAPLYMVFPPVEILTIDITGLTQVEVNAAFLSPLNYIQVEESKMYMAIPYRTTLMQDPQCDNLLYVGRDLKGTIKALHDAVRKAARALKLNKTSFVEEWDWLDGDEQEVVATIKEKKNGLLRQWQIGERSV